MEFDLFYVAGALGSVAFAISGYLAGARKHLDVMGILIITLITANGGGVIRDLLVGRTPVLLTDISIFYFVCTVFAGALLLRLDRYANIERHFLFVLSDAVGLAAFGMTGAMVGIEAQLSLFGVMALAFITASGGGILRDVVLREVPAVLSSDFYGSVAILLAAALYALEQLGLRTDTAMTLAFAAALALRLLAYWRGWHLPRIKLPE